MRRTACALAALLLLSASPAFAGDDDSPWPENASNAANIRAAAIVLRDLEARAEQLQLSADRYARWDACLRAVPVSEYGDPDRHVGFDYDERDGTGVGPMPALAVDRRRVGPRRLPLHRRRARLDVHERRPGPGRDRRRGVGTRATPA